MTFPMQHLGDNVSSNVDNFVFDGAKTSFSGSFFVQLNLDLFVTLLWRLFKRFAIMKKLLFAALADDKIRQHRG